MRKNQITLNVINEYIWKWWDHIAILVFIGAEERLKELQNEEWVYNEVDDCPINIHLTFKCQAKWRNNSIPENNQDKEDIPYRFKNTKWTDNIPRNNLFLF